MTTIHNEHLGADEFLDLHIEAARQQFSAATVEPFARKLRASLAPTPRARRPSPGWSALVGAAALVVVAVSLIALLLPGGTGSALAQAREWLEQFHTLQVETTIMDEGAVANVVVWFDGSGDTRIETSDSVTIIKPDEGMIYMLRSDGQNFAERLGSREVVEDSMAFIDVIRTFKEGARRVTDSRTVGGVAAVGYELTSDRSIVVLWVDPSDGRPLLVETEAPDGRTMRSMLRFDVPLPENAFTVPDDVRLPDQG